MADQKEKDNDKKIKCPRPSDSDIVEKDTNEKKKAKKLQVAVITPIRRPTDVEIMQQALDDITKNLDYLSGAPSMSLVRHVYDALEEITHLAEDMDNANDFYKIGGFDVLPQLLDANVSNLVIKAEELVGVLAQNNAFAQEKLVKMNVIDKLFSLLTTTNFDVVLIRIKALFAISCLCRNNKEGYQRFEELGGPLLLFELLETNNRQLKEKAAFLLSSFVASQPTLRDFIFDVGFLSKLVTLVILSTDQSEEFMLLSLLEQVTNHFESKNFCSGLISFQAVLEEKLLRYNNRTRYLERIDYASQLLAILYGTP